MSVVIDATGDFDQKKSDCHLLPVNIKHDGPANVSGFFKPIITEKNGALTASFRGKPLIGKRLELPEGYVGVVAAETEPPVEKKSTKPKLKKKVKAYKAEKSFTDFVYWKWDQHPGENDQIKQALAWLDVAKAIHK